MTFSFLYVVLSDLEAKILCEAAIQCEKISIARDLLLMSLGLCPEYVPSLLALANLELAVLERKSGVTSGVHDGQERKLYGNICAQKSPKDKKDRTSDSGNEVQGPSLCMESQAYSYAMSAVRCKEFNPECWHALGRVYQVFGLPVEAAESFSNALEHLKYAPIRPFTTVLTDSTIRMTK